MCVGTAPLGIASLAALLTNCSKVWTPALVAVAPLMSDPEPRRAWLHDADRPIPPYHPELRPGRGLQLGGRTRDRLSRRDSSCLSSGGTAWSSEQDVQAVASATRPTAKPATAAIPGSFLMDAAPFQVGNACIPSCRLPMCRCARHNRRAQLEVRQASHLLLFWKDLLVARRVAYRPCVRRNYRGR